MIILELVVISRPDHILEIRDVSVLPMVGDFVNREESGWIGFVVNRLFTIRGDGTTVVRCLLQKELP